MARIVDIASIDKNFSGSENINEPNIRYYDVKDEPFEIYGLYDPKGQDVFKRLPDEVAKGTNSGVSRLYKNTAGGRVRFSTDSDYLVIRVGMTDLTEFGHMPRLGVRGFDLYVDDPECGTSSYYGSYTPPMVIDGGFEGIIKFKDKKHRCLTLNMPLYNEVTSLYIGLSEDATLGGGARYRNVKPIVYYGSSITQGGCASRPGNSYQSMIARRMNVDYINLGFSGSGRAEEIIVNYMSGLEMSAFVSDYDHNAPTVEYLQDTHYKMYETIRRANPELPYIMVSRPDFRKSDSSGLRDSQRRRAVIFDSYTRARAAGDENVYFIDGESFFAGEYEDSCTVDGCHPNDLGFSKMASVIGNCLIKLCLK